jgi:hypothetical protein
VAAVAGRDLVAAKEIVVVGVADKR